MPYGFEPYDVNGMRELFGDRVFFGETPKMFPYEPPPDAQYGLEEPAAGGRHRDFSGVLAYGVDRLNIDEGRPA